MQNSGFLSELFASEPLLSITIGAGSGLVAGLLSLASGAGLFGRRRRSRRAQPARTLDDRLSDLENVTVVMRRMVSEVQAEASAQIAIAERAAREAKQNEQLASLSAEQAAAVAGVFAEQGKSSNKLAIWIGIASLIISNVVSVVVTLIVSS